MDPGTLALELVFIVVLALTNGLLSMSEMAMVSSRKIRLQQAAQNGSSGAKAALKLLEEPSRFLAAIQIGITLIGVFAGAFGGANMSEQISKVLADVPVLAPYAEPIGLGIVVILVTLLSLILGELVPKRLALGNSEGIAILMARPIMGISFVSRPAVRFLSAATEGILKVFRYKEPAEPPVTDEEVTFLVKQGAESGVFEREEESIIRRTLRLSDKTVDEVMTQRIHLVCLDIDDPIEVQLEKIKKAKHSDYPVYQGSMDHIIGMVSMKQIFEKIIENKPIELKSLMQDALYVPETMAALKLLEMFKASGKHFAVAIDEYGGVSGVVTTIDLLESIVGEMPELGENRVGEYAVKRDDGSWLVDGIMPLDRVAGLLHEEEEFFGDEYQTLGGFLMGELGHIPHAGNKVLWRNLWFEIMDMDGNRVDKVLIYAAQR